MATRHDEERLGNGQAALLTLLAWDLRDMSDAELAAAERSTDAALAGIQSTDAEGEEYGRVESELIDRVKGIMAEKKRRSGA